MWLKYKLVSPPISHSNTLFVTIGTYNQSSSFLCNSVKVGNHILCSIWYVNWPTYSLPIIEPLWIARVHNKGHVHNFEIQVVRKHLQVSIFASSFIGRFEVPISIFSLFGLINFEMWIVHTSPIKFFSCAGPSSYLPSMFGIHQPFPFL